MIFIIDDDEIMAECIADACHQPTQIFTNAIDAINALSQSLPKLIFLDVLLDGPDGFTFLNELSSYQDTAKIPVVLVSSLDMQNYNLQDYGIVGKLDKTTMVPKDIQNYVSQFCA